MTGRLVLLALAVPLACGCSTEGELQHGTFSYKCVAMEDIACGGSITAAVEIPPAIAVGGRFLLTFAPFEGAGKFTMLPASSSRAAITAGEVVLTDDGDQALLAKSDTGQIVDFALVHGETVADLFLSEKVGGMALASIEIAQGDAVPFYARPVSAAGETLPGGFAYNWMVEDEAIATAMVDSASTAKATITGMELGSTQLTLSAENVENPVTFFLKVVPP